MATARNIKAKLGLISEEEEQAPRSSGRDGDGGGGGESGGGKPDPPEVQMTDRAFAKWVSGMRPLMDIKGEDIKNLIGAMKGVSILVHICESFKEDAVVDDALFILFELCTSPVATEEFIVLGGLQVSVDLLLDEERSGSLHSHTLALLTRVVTSDELKTSLIEIGVMPAMIRLVNRTNDKNEVYGRTDRAIVKRSLTLMWMCSSLESIVDYYRSLGEQVVGPLLTLCEIDFDNEVLDMASGLLDKLCFEDPKVKETFVKLNAVSALLRVLSHAPDPSPKEHAMSVLAVLCEDPTIRRGIIEKGGLAPMVMSTHHGETMLIRKHAGVVLAEISLSNEMAPQLLMLEGGKVFKHLEGGGSKKKSSGGANTRGGYDTAARKADEKNQAALASSAKKKDEAKRNSVTNVALIE